ncbi:MAG TPA: hypothetical protein DCZ94_14455 [Lentisphaeria bacterium]|nr:MAG: hypothetical protein A2X48_03500 [Lentisphaerae bacterium GWF2_49_21]HBC88148.1 hypothetical protein [Lentisphaeria bacterium]
MKIKTLLIAAAVTITTLISSQAEEPAKKKLAQSIPEEVMFSVRLDLNAARKEKETKTILDAAEKQFNDKLEKIGEFSGLDLGDITCVWINVVKDKEVLIILEGNFDTEDIMNSPVVANSRKLPRLGTLTTIEMKDEQKNELNQGVLINENIVAFGRPELVDKFISKYVDGKTGWDKDGLAVMDRLAASNAMLNLSLMKLPEQEIQQKPFLANLVNASLEMNMVEKKISATAKVTMQDEAKAKALKDLLSGLVVLDITSEIKVDQPEIKKAIIDGLKLGNEGRTATLSSSMDIELLRNLLRKKGLELN